MQNGTVTSPKPCLSLTAPFSWDVTTFTVPASAAQTTDSDSDSGFDSHDVCIPLLVFCCLLGPLFCVALVCVYMCSVSWLFWLSCQYLSSDWLETLLWGSLIMIRRLSPQSPGRRVLMTFSVCFIVLLCVFSCPQALRDIFHTPLAQYSLTR